MTAEETETECEKEVSFENKNPKPAGKLKCFGMNLLPAETD